MAITARPHAQQKPVTGDVLERRDLLGHPGQRAQRHDEHAHAEPDAPGGASRGGQRDQAVENRHTGPGDQLVNHPHRLEPQVLGVTGRRHDVGRGSISCPQGRKDNTHIHDSHPVTFSAVSYLL